MNRSSRTGVAVSDDALRSELPDALLAAESDYDIIVVESIPHAYSDGPQRRHHPLHKLTKPVRRRRYGWAPR
jgi:hypothetical protein